MELTKNAQSPIIISRTRFSIYCKKMIIWVPFIDAEIMKSHFSLF